MTIVPTTPSSPSRHDGPDRVGRDVKISIGPDEKICLEDCGEKTSPVASGRPHLLDGPSARFLPLTSTLAPRPQLRKGGPHGPRRKVGAASLAQPSPSSQGDRLVQAETASTSGMNLDWDFVPPERVLPWGSTGGPIPVYALRRKTKSPMGVVNDPSRSSSTSVSDQAPIGLTVDLVLDTVLRASVDTTISTQSLRYLYGLGPVVLERLRPDEDHLNATERRDLAAGVYTGRGVAFVPLPQAEHFTGLNRRTINKIDSEVAERLGCLRRVSNGAKNQLVEDRSYGDSSAWTTIEPAPQKHALAEGLDLLDIEKLMDPASRWWSRRHAAWRLGMALFATYGFAETGGITLALVSDLLGVSKARAGVVRKDLLLVRGDIWMPDWFRMGQTYPAQEVFDNRLERDAWLNKKLRERGDLDDEHEVLGGRIVHVAPPEETKERVSLAERTPEEMEAWRGRVKLLRAQIQGDGRPGLVSALAIAESDLAFEEARASWTGEAGEAEVSRLRGRRDWIRCEIDSLDLVAT